MISVRLKRSYGTAVFSVGTANPESNVARKIVLGIILHPIPSPQKR
jgi:hypothetical protein